MKTSSANILRFKPQIDDSAKYAELKNLSPRGNEKDTILSVIYAPDPRTGLPNNEYCIYLSNKTNPAVREFISQNLLQPTSGRNHIPCDFNEDMSEFTRGEYETNFEYIQRVSKRLDELKKVESKTS